MIQSLKSLNLKNLLVIMPIHQSGSNTYPYPPLPSKTPKTTKNPIRAGQKPRFFEISISQLDSLEEAAMNGNGTGIGSGGDAINKQVFIPCI